MMLAPRTIGVATTSGNIANQKTGKSLPSPFNPSGSEVTASEIVNVNTGAAPTKAPNSTDLMNGHIDTE